MATGKADAVQRDRPRRAQPVLITDAAEDPERELRRREVRYVAMMLTRALCLVGGAVVVVQKPPLWGLWAVILVIGMVVLPWLAVILANDRAPRKRQAPHRREVPGQLSLPAPRDDRTIEPD
jgi:Protein of unknown function (DUF3099)